MTVNNAYAGVRPDIFKLIPDCLYGRVLDIGCSSGELGKQIKIEFPDVHVTGIDVCDHAIELASKVLDETKCESVDGGISYADETFDVVILADVLEHSVDPSFVLSEARRVLRPGGTAIISLPNICHISARLAILFGEWPERDRGIFDTTHLHFFSRAKMKRLISDTCFSVANESGNYRLCDDPKSLVNRLLKRFPGIPLGWFGSLFVYQFLVVCRK